MDLQPLITGDFEVTVMRGLTPTAANGWNFVENSTIDVQEWIPPNGARWLLVFTDQTGEVQQRLGAVRPLAFLGISDVPLVAPGEWPICAVRLYTEQERLVEDSETVDLVDLRFVSQRHAYQIFRNVVLLEAEMDFALTRLAVQAGLERRNAAITAAELDFAISKHVVGG
jgi:hypothetical protein